LPSGAAGAATFELMLTPFQGKRSGRAFGYSVFKVLTFKKRVYTFIIQQKDIR
jgi:hypothetical protein